MFLLAILVPCTRDGAGAQIGIAADRHPVLSASSLWRGNIAGLILKTDGAMQVGAAAMQAVASPLRLRGGKATGLGQRLQNLHYVMKKDPEGYIPEVRGHLDNWQASVRAWKRAPDLAHQELGELSVFLGSNINKFPSLLEDFGPQLLDLLARNCSDMCSPLRLDITKAIAIANSRKSIPVTDMCRTFFSMFHLADKRLRIYLYSTCLSAIKRMNSQSVNLNVNRDLQRQLAVFLHGSDTRSGRLAISLMVHLYRHNF